MKTYRAVYERDRDEPDAWNVHVPSVKGCRTYGRSLAQARERIREALTLFDEGAFDVVDDIRLPPVLRRIVRAQKAARVKAEAQSRRAQAALRQAARRLTGARLSVRDAGALLDISHQRVQQLLG